MVGSHLADFLLEKTDWDIYGMTRWRSPLDNIAHLTDRINNQDRIFLRYGDLLDQQSLNLLIAEVQPDYVFHLAAQSYPDASFIYPEQTLDTNVLGTLRLLEAVRHYSQKSPIVHICSSSEVFGRVPREQMPISESTPFSPASPYSISKIGTDFLGRYYADAYGIHTLTTRMFTHTGPRRGDVFVESSFAKQIALAEAGHIPPEVSVGNLDSTRTWADVRDAVRAYHLMVITHLPKGSVFNIGGNYSCTIREMLNFLISQSSLRDSLRIKVDSTRLRPVDADMQIPDTSLFRSATGWVPEYSFEQTMGDLLRYWRDRVFHQGSLWAR